MSNPLLADSGLPTFSAILPEHVEPAVTAVLAENREQIEALVRETNGSAADFERAILPLEALSERLQRTWAPVSHLHAVANNPGLREAYNACLPVLTRYETELSQDQRLWALYRAAADQLPGDSDAGVRRLLELALRDFHLAGVDLPADKKQRFGEIAEELSQLQAKFEQNVMDCMAAWSHHETREERLAGIPASHLEQAAADAREAGKEGWLFHLNQPVYVAVLTHAQDRDLRRHFYRAWATRASDQAPDGEAWDNSAIIDQILKLRHEAAGLVGYANYAEYSLASKMAGSVDEVLEFLDDLALKTHTAAKRELEELERFAGQALAAWDIAFYAEQLREERYSVSDGELRPYFPLDRVLGGLFQLVERLYGIRIEAVDGVDTWRPETRYYQVKDSSGEEIGGFFTDLFARKEKRSGAWMDVCLTRKTWTGVSQAPVAHLVCNFAAPTVSTPSLLSHEEVLTLFHEFGHTLHHVLTRVGYPSVAGINGVPWDAVELPSQFMENFAWEPEVVTLISGHYRTGEPLPEALLEKLQASRVFHAGLQIVRQLEFAIFDLRLHAEYDPRRGSRLNRIMSDVRSRVSVIRHPEYNRMAHSFAHIFGGGYAAGYYSYKWAEVLAADAWSAFQEGGIFEPETARRFRQQILEVGGTVDIGEAFKAFRGRAPQIEPLLVQSGILPPGRSRG